MSALVNHPHHEYISAVPANGTKNLLCEDKSEAINLYDDAGDVHLFVSEEWAVFLRAVLGREDNGGCTRSTRVNGILVSRQSWDIVQGGDTRHAELVTRAIDYFL